MCSATIMVGGRIGHECAIVERAGICSATIRNGRIGHECAIVERAGVGPASVISRVARHHTVRDDRGCRLAPDAPARTVCQPALEGLSRALCQREACQRRPVCQIDAPHRCRAVCRLIAHDARHRRPAKTSHAYRFGHRQPIAQPIHRPRTRLINARGHQDVVARHCRIHRKLDVGGGGGPGRVGRRRARTIEVDVVCGGVRRKRQARFDPSHRSRLPCLA